MGLRRVAAALAALLLALGAGDSAAQQPGQPWRQPLPPPPPPPPPPEQPIVVARGCATPWGTCPLAVYVPPGARCYCQTPDNRYLPGYAVEYLSTWP